LEARVEGEVPDFEKIVVEPHGYADILKAHGDQGDVQGSHNN
jgi:hypothetical protein